MIVANSLHNRYNRNNARKCFKNTSTGKILCTDSNRSIRKANDWTFACLVNWSGLNTVSSLYSDYNTNEGIAMALDSVSSPTETYVRMISREGGVGSATYYNLGSILENRWISIIISYDSTLNEITVYCNGEDVGNNTDGNKLFPATIEWATNTEFSLFGNPPPFGDTFNMEGLCSSYCILNKQADFDFINNFNIFGEPNKLGELDVTFFTDFSKINVQDTYTGIECSSKFYNRLGTDIKEIRFEGFTDEELGLDTFNIGISPNCLFRGFYEEDRELEDQFGLDMGRTFYKTHPTVFSYQANLKSGAIQPTLGWANGYTVVAKGNWASQQVGNFSPEPVIWFNSQVINLIIVSSNIARVLLTPSTVGDPVIGILDTVHEVDAHNVYTLTVNPIVGGQADYILYINGKQVATDTQEYRTLDPAPTQVDRFVFGSLVSGTNVRYAKYHSAIRVYDRVLTPTECQSVLGSELDTYSGLLCKYTTNLDGSGNLIDDLGNLNNTFPLITQVAMTEDLVVEVSSGLQIRRKGLNFEKLNEEYLEVPNLPQIDLNVGVTIIAIINDFQNTPARNLYLFNDLDDLDNVIRLVYRRDITAPIEPETDFILGFNSGTGAGEEIRYFENSEDISTTTVFRVTSQLIEAPKYKGTKIARTNERQGALNFPSVRTGATYTLYIGGNLNLTFVNGSPLAELFANVTFESFMVVNGVLEDDEVREIVSKGKYNNPTKELLDKYDFELIVDFNRVYDDGGTVKLYDLSGNEHDILPKSNLTVSPTWQTVVDVENSQTDL